MPCTQGGGSVAHNGCGVAEACSTCVFACTQHTPLGTVPTHAMSSSTPHAHPFRHYLAPVTMLAIFATSSLGGLPLQPDQVDQPVWQDVLFRMTVVPNNPPQKDNAHRTATDAGGCHHPGRGRACDARSIRRVQPCDRILNLPLRHSFTLPGMPFSVESVFAEDVGGHSQRISHKQHYELSRKSPKVKTSDDRNT